MLPWVGAIRRVSVRPLDRPTVLFFFRVPEPSKKYGTRALRWNRTNDLPVMSRVLWSTELAMRLSDADAERLSLS